MIRAVFFDIDGTLVSFKTHTIPQGTLEALERARRAGLRLYVSTGRHRTVIGKGSVLEGVDFDGYITLNGQYCYDDTGIVYQNPIHPGDVAAMLDAAESRGIACGFVEEDRMYLNRENEQVRTAHRSVAVAAPPVCDASRAREHAIYQMLLYVPPQEEPALMRLMPHCDATRWSPLFADIVPRGGSKRLGIERVMERCGYGKEETMAFGDGENDIEMLRCVGLGVAMGNAAPLVKESADYIAPSVDQDGVRRTLEHFGLI